MCMYQVFHLADSGSLLSEHFQACHWNQLLRDRHILLSVLMISSSRYDALYKREIITALALCYSMPVLDFSLVGYLILFSTLKEIIYWNHLLLFQTCILWHTKYYIITYLELFWSIFILFFPVSVVLSIHLKLILTFIQDCDISEYVKVT